MLVLITLWDIQITHIGDTWKGEFKAEEKIARIIGEVLLSGLENQEKEVFQKKKRKFLLSESIS